MKVLTFNSFRFLELSSKADHQAALHVEAS